jgi:hypothetical protein
MVQGVSFVIHLLEVMLGLAKKENQYPVNG